MGSSPIAESKRKREIMSALRAAHQKAVEEGQPQPPIPGDPMERHAKTIQTLRTGIEFLNEGLRPDKKLTFKSEGLDGKGNPFFLVMQGEDRIVWSIGIADSLHVGGPLQIRPFAF